MIQFVFYHHLHWLSCWDSGGEQSCLPAGMGEGWRQADKGLGSGKSFWGPGADGALLEEAQKAPTGAAVRTHREVSPWRPSGPTLTFHKWGN